jgi:DNA-binding SARP family transcriptional activator
MTDSLTTPAPPGSARLYLLGSFRLEISGQLVRLPTRKTESLLAYLALHPAAGGHSREKIAAIFWGDVTDEDARRSLRVTLSALRKALVADCLLTDRETVQINPAWSLWVDAADVAERSMRELDGVRGEPGDLCAELYCDDLLPGFSDEWVESERVRIRDLHRSELIAISA